MKVIGPKAKSLPAKYGGNDVVWELIQLCNSRGLFVETQGETVFIDGITDKSLLTWPVVQFLVSEGFEVHDFQMFFEVDDLDAEIPGTNPRFDVTDENGNTTRKKWADLNVDDRGPWTEVAGKFYRGTEMEPHGEKLLATELMELVAAGVSLVESVPSE